METRSHAARASATLRVSSSIGHSEDAGQVANRTQVLSIATIVPLPGRLFTEALVSRPALGQPLPRRPLEQPRLRLHLNRPVAVISRQRGAAIDLWLNCVTVNDLPPVPLPPSLRIGSLAPAPK